MKLKNLDKNFLKTSTKIFFLIAITTLLSAGCNSQQKQDPLQRPVNTSSENSNSTDNNSQTTDSQNNEQVKVVSGESPKENGQVAGTTTTQLLTQKISVAGHELTVEVADTDETRSQGLSNREKLDDGKGMWFDFTNTNFRKPGFYMKDMLFSIDILWINNGKIIGVEKNIPLPEPNKDLIIYYPPSEITHVLEVPAGWVDRNSITTSF